VKGTDPGQQKRPDEIEARLKLQSTLRRRFAVGLGMIIFSILLGLGGWAVVIGITLVESPQYSRRLLASGTRYSGYRRPTIVE